MELLQVFWRADLVQNPMSECTYVLNKIAKDQKNQNEYEQIQNHGPFKTWNY